MRECTKCGVRKEWEEFYRDSRGKNGRCSRCKKCTDGNKLEWLNRPGNRQKQANGSAQRYIQDRVRRRFQAIYKKYGVTQEWYDQTLVSQGKGCRICGTDKPGRGDTRRRLFCIDHDHKTGKIRGLLCINCNMVLGAVDDSREILSKAIEYLEEYNEDSQAGSKTGLGNS
jgi:hypothetical protein